MNKVGYKNNFKIFPINSKQIMTKPNESYVVNHATNPIISLYIKNLISTPSSLTRNLQSALKTFFFSSFSYYFCDKKNGGDRDKGTFNPKFEYGV